MSGLLSYSQGLVLATAVIVSTTAFLLALSRQKSCPPPQMSETDQKPDRQAFRSCLSTEEKRKERKDKKKKKKVQFADHVKEPGGVSGELNNQKGYKSEELSRICRSEIPANRVALYNGILRDRVHKMKYSY